MVAMVDVINRMPISMILEHSKDPVSAKWDKDLNRWDIGEKKKYRWCNTKNKPESDWFYDITDALEWIMDKNSNQSAGHIS